MPPRQTYARLPAFCSFVLVILVLAGFAPTGAAAPAEVLPSQDELHQLFEQKQYPNLLQKIARVLTLKGDAAKAYDRHDILRLKAETDLRLKAYAAAEQAFTAASKETTDETPADVDLATALLIHRSRAGQYQPVAKVNGNAADAISIIEPEPRKLALQALFQDKLVADGPRITAVQNATRLEPILSAAPMIADLQTIEMGATEGRDEQTRQLIAAVSKHAQSMMADAVHNLSDRDAAIVSRANQQIGGADVGAAGTIVNHVRTTRRGYDDNDRRELSEIRLACEKIAPAARAFGNALGPSGADLISVSDAAERLAKQAGP